MTSKGPKKLTLRQEHDLLCAALLKITEFHNGEHFYLKDCNACHRQEIACKVLQLIGKL